MPNPIPIHQWTRTGNKVLFVKMISRDRKTGGQKLDGGGKAPVIEWPKSGKVECADWNSKAECGGGIQAWPWGMFIGDGKDPDACVPWLVLAVDPADVVQIDGGKCKFPRCEIAYNGDMAGAMYATLEGRIAWIIANSDGNNAKGYSSSAASNGDSSSAASNGDRSSAASNGDSSSAASNGGSSSAASNGDSSSAASNGDLSVATVRGEDGKIELSANATGIVSGESFTWVVHIGAVVVQRWQDGDKFPTKFLDSVVLGLDEGEIVKVNRGEVTRAKK